ncbi:MAG: DNA mismatch endonuclease Vsr [Planctomycetaceae bacterium]|nr:DNA mismatch endonuclease Vsr [Planctomycetaceae bacterium]
MHVNESVGGGPIGRTLAALSAVLVVENITCRIIWCKPVPADTIPSIPVRLYHIRYGCQREFAVRSRSDYGCAKVTVDTLSVTERSRVMSLVGRRDTGPEMIVRRLLHSRGFRYRLHVKTLPGTPDIVLPSRRTVIFVHGCFWHRHRKTCPLTRMPKSRVEFWTAKFVRNRKRDDAVRRRLRVEGWKVITIWECETRNLNRLAIRLSALLDISWAVP